MPTSISDSTFENIRSFCDRFYNFFLFFFVLWFKYDTSMKLGQRTGATVNDLWKINAMYNCNTAGEHYQRQSDEHSSPFYIF